MTFSNENHGPFRVIPRTDRPVVVHTDYNACQHRDVLFEVDEAAGTVKCLHCNKFLDPIQALILVSHHFSWRDRKFAAIQDWEKKQVKKKDADMLRRIARGKP